MKKTVPWPAVKRSEPAAKYRKKGQGNKKKKQSNISGFGGEKKKYAYGNLDRTDIVIGIVSLFLKTPPSVEQHDYAK